MKKTQKRLLGAAGLALVAGMTIIAAQLPGPDASAANNSVTDNISVRVVGDVASIKFTAPANGSKVYASKQTIKWEYEDTDLITVTLKYTDMDGNAHNIGTLWTLNPEFKPGEAEREIELSTYGYGTFEFVATGRDVNGATTATETLVFEYLEPDSDINISENGDLWVDFDYDPANVTEIVTTVYKGDGDSGEVAWTETLRTGATGVLIPGTVFESGQKYTIVVSYYNGASLIYRDTTPYTAPVTPDTNAPDTGGLFQNLNISREDYLVTGLLIFMVFAIVGFGVIFRNHKTKSSKRR